MAKRSEELDRKIHDAAYSEFYEKGFMDASVRGIAYRAGVTMGALYSRYSSKEELFLSCVSDLIKALTSSLDQIKDLYIAAAEDGRPEKMQEALDFETEVMTTAIMSNYDQAVLLFRRGTGSGVEDMIKTVVDSKVEGTLYYFDAIGKQIDPDMLHYLIDMQVHAGLAFIEPGRCIEDARRFMDVNYYYHTAGWNAVSGMLITDVQEDGEKD